MLTQEELNKMNEIMEFLEERGDDMKELLEDEVKAIIASIDEEIQKNHIVLFQELVITQTIIMLQKVLIDAVIDGDFAKEDEDGVAHAIDVLTDCLAAQEMDLRITALGTHLADEGFMDMLEEEEE